MNRYKWVGVVLTVVLVASVLLLRAVNVYDLTYKEEGKVRGGPSSVVTVVEYSDFQCGMCQELQPILKKFLEEHPGKIRLQFKHFPLNTHEKALWAHIAAESAHKQGKFWEYHDLLYQSQNTWVQAQQTLPYFLEYAKKLGLDLEQFESDFINPEILETVRNEKISGKKIGLFRTPTLVVGDKIFMGLDQMNEFKQYVLDRINE